MACGDCKRKKCKGFKAITCGLQAIWDTFWSPTNVKKLFSNPWEYVKDICDALWRLHSWAYEFIFCTIFGICDKKVRSCDLVTTKIMDEDLLTVTRERLVMDWLKKDQDAIDYAMAYGQTGAFQFLQYYNTGRFEFEDRLASGTVIGMSIDTPLVKSITKAREMGFDLEYNTIYYGIPNKDDWVSWYLQEQYGANLLDNSIIISIKVQPTNPRLRVCYDENGNEVPCPEVYNDQGILIKVPVCMDANGETFECPDITDPEDDRKCYGYNATDELEEIECPKVYDKYGNQIPIPRCFSANAGEIKEPCDIVVCKDSGGMVVTCPGEDEETNLDISYEIIPMDCSEEFGQLAECPHCEDNDGNTIKCPQLIRCYDEFHNEIECPPYVPCYDEFGVEIPCPDPIICYNENHEEIPCPKDCVDESTGDPIDCTCLDIEGYEIDCPKPCRDKFGAIVSCPEPCLDIYGNLMACPEPPEMPEPFYTDIEGYIAHADYDSSGNNIIVRFCDEEGTLYDYTLTIPAPPKNKEYYVVSYDIPAKGESRIWIYDPSTNAYPQLMAGKRIAVDLEMYPIVCYRNNYFNLSEYNKSKKCIPFGNCVDEMAWKPPKITKRYYENADRMLGALGMSVKMLEETIQGEDATYIHDAFFLLGVSPAYKNETISRLLFLMFDEFNTKILPEDINHDTSVSLSVDEYPYNFVLSYTPRITTYTPGKLSASGMIDTFTHSIEEHFWEEKTAIKTTTIKNCNKDGCTTSGPYCTCGTAGKTRSPRVFGRSGAASQQKVDGVDIVSIKCGYEQQPCYYGWVTKCSMVCIAKEKGQCYQYGKGNCKKEWGLICPRVCMKTVRYRGLRLVLKRQETADTIKTVIVDNVTAVAVIRSGLSRPGDGQATAEYSSAIRMQLTDSRLLLPLPVKYTEDLSLMDRTDILSWTPHIQFYTYAIQYLRWYQTKAFADTVKVLAIVVIIVVTVLSCVYGGCQGYTLSQILLQTLLNAGLGMAVGYALRWIAKNVGGKFALVLAAIAVVATMVAGGVGSTNLLMDAVQLANLASEAFNMYLGEKTANLQNEYQSFNESYQKRLDDMDSKRKELEGKSALTPEYLAMLAGMDVPPNKHACTSMSPSVIRDLMIDAGMDFGLIYDRKNPAATFVDEQIRIGILED